MPQMETIRALVIDQEIARQDTGVFTDIITLNISGSGMLRKLYQPPKVLTCAPLLASCKALCADRSEPSAVGIMR